MERFQVFRPLHPACRGTMIIDAVIQFIFIFAKTKKTDNKSVHISNSREIDRHLIKYNGIQFLQVEMMGCFSLTISLINRLTREVKRHGSGMYVKNALCDEMDDMEKRIHHLDIFKDCNFCYMYC